MSFAIFENSNDYFSCNFKPALLVGVFSSKELGIKAFELVNARVIVQTALLSFVVVFFIFSIPSKVIIIVIQFMFLGINMFLTLVSELNLNLA